MATRSRRIVQVRGRRAIKIDTTKNRFFFIRDFLSSRFVTRHFDATDAEVLTRVRQPWARPFSIDDAISFPQEYPACHYRGQVRDVPDSHVVISTCGGIK